MSMVYEDAACLLLALCSGTLQFTLSAMCVMLGTAGGIAWRRSRELARIPDRLMARLTAEPRVP
jgi:hypothetical protein